ncbi:syntaxin-binding protein 5-like [Platysternon megacephalum]|uniref:Syntaxin-binding protein 5-like n=1 Tax=Platysternon megacephalum TaxID=55544 RepID=A0A4D9E4G9_9SAUR|nr:syntaxin-binding protein 5-like [Platysternon megacephalum]
MGWGDAARERAEEVRRCLCACFWCSHGGRNVRSLFTEMAAVKADDEPNCKGSAIPSLRSLNARSEFDLIHQLAFLRLAKVQEGIILNSLKTCYRVFVQGSACPRAFPCGRALWRRTWQLFFLLEHRAAKIPSFHLLQCTGTFLPDQCSVSREREQKQEYRHRYRKESWTQIHPHCVTNFPSPNGHNGFCFRTQDELTGHQGEQEVTY